MRDPDGSAFELTAHNSAAPARLPLTGVVLAGGQSRRMGTDKALLAFDGQPLVSRVAATLAEACAEVMVVATDSPALADVALPAGTRVLADEVAFQGPLGGLATALSAARHEWVFACGVDMPFLCAGVVRLLWDVLAAEQARVGHSALQLVMPMGDAGPEPLLSLYNVNCLPAVHRLLAEGSHKVVDLCGQVEVLAVPVEQLRAADPRLLSLLNVNTAADLDAARAIAREVAAK